MLLPFDFAILTAAEAQLLIQFIETSTATKSQPKNYDKMAKVGILEMYNKLRDFVEAANQYENNLRDFDPYTKADKE